MTAVRDTHRQHGTRVKYVVDRCRCSPCRAANSVAEAERSRQQAYGRWQPYIDADPARRHVLRLGRQGMGWKRVARSAGLSPSTVWKLIYGDPSRGQVPSKRVRPATAEKLLAVELDLAAGAIVPSIGTARRIQALVAIGWSQSKIAAQIGMNRSNFGPLAHGRRDVTAGTAAAVRKIYDELSMTPAPVSLVHERSSVSRSLRFAAVAGWVTPLAWDDDTIDDPAAVPQVGAPARRDLVEDYDWLVENGESRWSALQILGVTQSAIDHARRRQTAAA